MRCISFFSKISAAGSMLCATTALLLNSADGAFAQTPAKQLFGYKQQPARMEARAIGSYARGCLAGGQAVPVDGPSWQVMRLSRNRNWGHPVLVDYVTRLARDAAASGDWPGLLVGDLAQPRGGPMLTGHASHQIGLDADIWLTPMPNRRLSAREREELSATSVVNFKTNEVNRSVWTNGHFRILKRAASYPGVARIFVNPIIKKELCAVAGNDRNWLRKIRPWLGHHYHFHVRMDCPAGYSGCKSQSVPPAGDGCGAELALWFKPPPPSKGKPKKKKKRSELTLASLPKACKSVLLSDGQVKLGSDFGGIVPFPTPRPR